MQSLGLIASTPALGRTKMLGERRRRRMQVSYRRQMLKATFMFWFKLEGMYIPPYSFLHCFRGISKNEHVWALTITTYSFLYYMGMNAHSMFLKCAHFFHDSWQVSQDKKRKKSLQVFMLHKKPSAIGFYWACSRLQI
jgi:hypothetical protein